VAAQAAVALLLLLLLRQALQGNVGRGIEDSGEGRRSEKQQTGHKQSAICLRVQH
jgi:hypothetical protein